MKWKEKFRAIWKNVFKITEEDEENFDEQHELTIKDRMIPLIHRTYPFEITDVERFNEHNLKFTIEELQEAIKHTKQRAPGISGITKIHLTQAPQKTINQILEIFNACLNIGYFPDTFKTSRMIFIPKPGKLYMMQKIIDQFPS